MAFIKFVAISEVKPRTVDVNATTSLLLLNLGVDVRFNCWHLNSG